MLNAELALLGRLGIQHSNFSTQTSTFSLLLDERSLSNLPEGRPQLFLRIHHDRSMPGNRFLERLAGYQQESNARLAGLHRHFVSSVENDEGAILRILIDGGVE